MRKIPILALAAIALGAVAYRPPVASASSHREAPFVTKNPKVDGTDFYMFNSYEAGRGAFTTIIANYQPFQDSWGGPNYFNMDPDALYEIMLDNTGDAKEDLTFQFQFSSVLANSGAGIGLPIGAKGAAVPIPLVAAGQIDGTGGMANQNVLESYTVNLVTGPRRTGKVAAVKNVGGGSTPTVFAKPMDNIGSKTFGDYATYAQSFIYDVTIPGCSTPGRVFVGQRADPFAVNIGPIFDLVDAPVGVITGGTDNANRNLVPNPLQCKNVSTIALELPTSCITTTTGPSKGIIGGWTTASVRQARVINPTATYAEPTVEGGPWAQVSRLGMPLVNEIVVGLPDKDGFNSSEPENDAKNVALVNYASYPTLPALVQLLFPAAVAPPTPRTDLVEVFALGVTGVNANGATAEYLRLNTAIPATPVGTQNNLGAAGCFINGTLTITGNAACDPAGFPNGRRPGDDVVDIALRVAEGYLIKDNATGAIPFTDAVIQDPSQFDVTFPYLTTPNSGAASGGATPACTGVSGLP
jgi:hypothetical protein